MGFPDELLDGNDQDVNVAEPVRWGIIGPGGIARGAIMPAFARVPGAQVIAVASSNRARAQQFAHDFAIPRIYGGYDLLVDDPDVEAIYIALPNHLHSEWTIRALQAGKHVLCEKPLAATVADAEAMAAAAADTGLCMMEAVMYRFHPRMREAWSLVHDGAIGEPRLLRASFCFTMSSPDNYRNQPEMGGGALLDVGSYCVNAARWLLEDEPVAAVALGTLMESGTDESVSGVLEFPSGALAQILCSYGTAEHQTLDIIGDTGTISLTLPFTAWINSEASIVLSHNGNVEETIFPPSDPYALMLEHFNDCVRGDDAPWLPPEDGVGTMRALEALRLAAASGQAERL